MNAADVIIVGSGIAGLSLSLKLADKGHTVHILTKRQKAECNTSYAQGGIACVMDLEDSAEDHIQDTLLAGGALCNPDVVAFIIKKGPERLRELLELGVNFCQNESGELALGQEGGHSKRRILHVKDMTGKAIETALLHKVTHHPRIQISEHWMAIDLILNDNRVVGLQALNTLQQSVEVLSAKVIVLATGGSGCVYAYTTNPAVATGDGVAMALRAGAKVSGMEFVQFHPTALYATSGERPLISEAIRGEGAILRNFSGNPFMKNFHPQADLAPRDIVVKAIDHEMKALKAPHVWLDFTHKSEEFIQDRFPNVWRVCQWHSINPARDWIPVVPAAHYQCGGVVTDTQGQTSIPGLYACGEVASTGLHGSNRLASNSLLEAVVIAAEAAEAINQEIANFKSINPLTHSASLNTTRTPSIDQELILNHTWRELRQLMWDYAGVVRTERCLEHATLKIEVLQKELDLYFKEWPLDMTLLELRNAIDVAQNIVQSALVANQATQSSVIQ